MAGVKFHLDAQAVNVLASTAKTVLRANAPANQRVKAKRLSFSAKGAGAADPQILIEILRVTSDGTMTAITPRKNNEGDDETIQTTAAKNATAEPTPGDVLFSMYVHPQALLIYDFPEDEEIEIKGGTKLGVRVTPGASPSSIDTNTSLMCEE